MIKHIALSFVAILIGLTGAFLMDTTPLETFSGSLMFIGLVIITAGNIFLSEIPKKKEP